MTPPLNIPAPKISQYHKDEFIRMHKELTDDEVIADNKRRFDRIKRIEDRKSDTGIYEKPKHKLVY